ncbi:sulfurtransferase [Shewanella algidipiscicola]|uniref:Sulfurtransferase n=2 Tax=Shewanella algidipiscicola TaxID=614070 RepID=A0ABQ4NTF0_9GAMM|nr:rhodanese-like domain-containing protein [Shewanella algidipiscicola]GIU02936.1 sulfurtransferase [Shewanella algidipiscicola]
MGQATTLLSRYGTMIALFFVAAIGLSSPSIAAEQDIETTAWQMIDNGAMIVDVRTPEEFAQGHLANAINIPFENIAAEFAKRNIDKATNVVLYCRSGRRSDIAQMSLIEQGYTNTHNGGGYQTLSQQQPK